MPPIDWRMPAKRKGGKPFTPIRITRNVVPQMMQIPAKQI
jgi:hypothetical protein